MSRMVQMGFHGTMPCGPGGTVGWDGHIGLSE